jgi:hypothetical protein
MMLSDPVFRMGPMIDLHCKASADFFITPKEKKKIERLYAKLKKKPERIEEPLMQLCQEWEKHKSSAR